MRKMFFFSTIIVILFTMKADKEASAAEVADSFRFPLDSYSVTGYEFGEHLWSGVYHLGEDAHATALTPVYAPANGVIVSSMTGWHDGFGWVGIIEHQLPNGNVVYSVSGHMRENGLRTSGDVLKGDVIGYIGYDNENGDGGPHLHFGIYYGSYSGSWVFYGRGTSTSNWYNPTDFIESHQSTCHNVEVCEPADYYDAVMIRAKRRSTAPTDKFNLDTYYQEDAGDPLTKWGPTASEVGNYSRNRGWFEGYMNNDQWADVVSWNITDGTKTKVFVWQATGNGGFYDSVKLLEAPIVAKQVFIEDWNDDDIDDIIIGYQRDNNDKMYWYVIENDGNLNEFSWGGDKTYWRNYDSSTGNFGKVGDIFVVMDGSGNGKAEIFRGRTDAGHCSSSKLDWSHLGNAGRANQHFACFGWASSQWLKGDIYGNSAEELVQVRMNQSQAMVYPRRWNGSTFINAGSNSRWSSNAGGTEGDYFLFPADADSRPDLIQWTSGGHLYWMKNTGSQFQTKSSRHSLYGATVPRNSSKDELLFEDFGQVASDEQTCWTEEVCEQAAQGVPDTPHYNDYAPQGNGSCTLIGSLEEGPAWIGDEYYDEWGSVTIYTEPEEWRWIGCQTEDCFIPYEGELTEAACDNGWTYCYWWYTTECEDVFYPDGMQEHELVKGDSSGSIYYLEDGFKRLIPSASVYLDCGFSWSDYVTHPQADVDSIPTGSNYSCP